MNMDRMAWVGLLASLLGGIAGFTGGVNVPAPIQPVPVVQPAPVQPDRLTKLEERFEALLTYLQSQKTIPAPVPRTTTGSKVGNKE